MNLLLLLPDEVTGDAAVVQGARALHLLGLLGKGPGDPVKAGVLGEGLCSAHVTAVDHPAERIHLRLGPRQPQPLPKTTLVLGLPRPKALSRIIQLVASFGVRRCALVGAHKVDPAYFASPRLVPERLASDALLGLAQGGLVHPPRIEVHRSLGVVLPTLDVRADGARVLLDPPANSQLPGADLSTVLSSSGWHADANVVLAFGPDGGFLPEEVGLFVAAGFERATLSASTLRTEVAVAVGLGQLELCRRLAEPAPALPSS